ncbi:hypothetical protein CCAX7_55230 [Capsulimonas corticalis]|uniref:Uncharacterized protein n=1 Tax=Capsulimonas corticalis TaxID=2219043 RepID=A0A402D5U3_9BACT|nr:hypothetical protein [Capsulimonas corticalis]BDI33472.1 hypothetical protein CCAX7_55230 [Capsulimonas corticalis]
MAWEPYVEFANFICKFGEDTNLLDLANDVVLPALLSHPEKYEFMSSTYFLYETRLEMLPFDGRDELCLVGTFIQDTRHRSVQVFDPELGLVESLSETPYATSASFVLILRNHKLLYYHETPEAPPLGSFKNVVTRNIRRYYKQYVDDRIAEAAAEVQSRKNPTKTAINAAKSATRRTYGRFTLEIISLSSEDDFRAYIQQMSRLVSVRIELVDTNDENDNDPFFDDVREKKEAIGSDRTALSHENTEGLNREEAINQLSAATAQGNSHISVVGFDEAGVEIRGGATDYKTRITLPLESRENRDGGSPDVEGNVISRTENAGILMRRMLSAFGAFVRRGVHIDETPEADAQIIESKIAAVQEQFNIGAG